MGAQGIEQSIHTIQSVSFRVLTAMKRVVQANEDVKRMDSGTEESLLVKVRTLMAKIIMV